MLALPSAKNDHFTLHFFPALITHVLKLKPDPTITWPVMASSPSRTSRQSSYDSQSSSQTIHSRRTLSRTSSSSHTPPPPALNGFSDFFNSRVTTPIAIPAPKESDAECWERMLALQMEYHCYKSARLEAAVEALERGWAVEEVPMPSRLCLDLLNEELKAQIESRQVVIRH